MKKSRYTEAQIVKILKEVEAGKLVKDACREYSIPTFVCNALTRKR